MSSTPHPGTREYRNQLVRLADLTVNEDMLQDLLFENCTIVGPAVLVPLTTVTLSNCTFASDGIDQLFWYIPPTRRSVLGAIGVERVEFYSCTFQRIGFAGDENLRNLLGGLPNKD